MSTSGYVNISGDPRAHRMDAVTHRSSQSALMISGSVGVVILSGFVLRATGLTSQSMWWDEVFSLDLAGQSLTNIIHGDFHPPLYHLLLSGWIKLAGSSDFAVRYLSVMFGTLLIPLAYSTARQILNHKTGQMAGLLVATSPALLWYSQEARMYILVALIYLGLIWLFHRLTDPNKPKAPAKLWLALALLEAAGLYTHYFIAVGISWLFVAFLCRLTIIPIIKCRYAPSGFHVSRITHHGSNLKYFVLSQTLVFVLYLPWLPVFRSLQSRYNPIDATPPALGVYISQIWHSFNAGSLAIVGHHDLFMVLSTSVAGLIGTLLLIVLIWGHSRPTHLWLLGHTVVPLVVIYLVMQVRPFFHPRYVVMLVPPLLISIAGLISSATFHTKFTPISRIPATYQLSRITHHASRITSLISLTTFLTCLTTFTTATYAFTTTPHYQRDDLRGLANHFSVTTSSGDGIIFGYLDHPFRRYYNSSETEVIYLDLGQPDGDVAGNLAQFLQEKKRATVISWNQAVVDRHGLLKWLLASSGRHINTENWGDFSINTYAIDGSVPRPAFERHEADYGLIKLIGSQMADTAPTSGGLTVATKWTLNDNAVGNYKLALRLRDHQGHIVSQSDVRLVSRSGDSVKRANETANYAVLSLPQGVIPGQYYANLAVYASDTMRHLERQDAPGQHVELGTVQLTHSDAAFRSAELPGFTQLGAELDSLYLSGYTLSHPEAGPGGKLSIALQWHITGEPRGTPVLQLVSNDQVLAESHDALFPATMWERGKWILDWRDLSVPLETKVGTANLQVVVGEMIHVVAPVTITMIDHRFEVPPMENTFQAQFGDVAELVGFDLQKSIGGDDVVDLVLYWRAGRASTVEYSVFTHLLDQNGQVIGQHDGVPDSGRRPTTGWIKDEIIVDSHAMIFNDKKTTGVAQVEIGLYDPATGQRLRMPEGSDHAILPAMVEVKP